MADITEQTVSSETQGDSQPVSTDVFISGGELGELCRRKDWSATPLGSAETWAPSLKVTTNIVLNSSFPMIILWGQELIQIYNDAYRLIMGTKHPSGLGQPSRECWPEVVDVTEPLYQRVLAGETISLNETPFSLAPNGFLETFYLTLCYAPLRDETGAINGIFVTLFNVTSEVQARSERDRAFAEAQIERQRLYEVFMQAPAAIAVLEGPEHTFTVTNPLYLELIGNRSVVGKSIREAMPELEGQGIYELLTSVRTTGVPFVTHDLLIKLDRDNDGVPEDFYVDFVYQPLTDAAGQVFGIMVHVVETTERVLSRQEIERKASELVQLTQDLEQSNRELEQFAYVTSHDLKAPLRGIANLATWIEEDIGDGISEDVRKHLELLRGRVHRMESLINGILDYSRAGRLTTPESVNTGALVREILDLQAPPDDIQIQVQPSMPTVESERIPLQQVFMNLIANAVKYTRAMRSDGQIHISWREAGPLYVFAVADNGPGIEPQYHERIWGIFQTLEARDKVEGAGIGLAIVKKMVERRGGRVWLESKPGEGSTFYFSWRKRAARHH